MSAHPPATPCKRRKDEPYKPSQVGLHHGTQINRVSAVPVKHRSRALRNSIPHVRVPSACMQDPRQRKSSGGISKMKRLILPRRRALALSGGMLMAVRWPRRCWHPAIARCGRRLADQAGALHQRLSARRADRHAVAHRLPRAARSSPASNSSSRTRAGRAAMSAPTPSPRRRPTATRSASTPSPRTSIAPTLYAKLPFDVGQGFRTGIAMLWSVPNMLDDAARPAGRRRCPS